MSSTAELPVFLPLTLTSRVFDLGLDSVFEGLGLGFQVLDNITL